MRRLALAVVLAAPAAVHGQAYLIGNSLTWDAQPALLDGSNGWHIDCNQTLPSIYDNPSRFCIGSSSDWSVALAAPYDVLSVQPFVGSTLAEDTAAISAWMTMQPGATVVIHTGWTHPFSHEAHYHSGWSGVESDPMRYSPEYFAALRGELLALHPGRTIIVNDMISVMDRVYHDIEAGVGPYAAFEDLYRDQIHLTLTDGRFLAHNTLRRTLGQPFSTAGFDGVPVDHRTYLLAVIEDCPADLDRDRDADVFDLLAFLDRWFAAPESEITDLLAYLDGWFAGC